MPPPDTSTMTCAYQHLRHVTVVRRRGFGTPSRFTCAAPTESVLPHSDAVQVREVLSHLISERRWIIVIIHEIPASTTARSVTAILKTGRVASTGSCVRHDRASTYRWTPLDLTSTDWTR